MAAVLALGGVAICACVGWTKLQPKVRMASISVMRATIPATLLPEPSNDPAAKDRYDKLVRLVKTLDPDEVHRLNRFFSMPSTRVAGVAARGEPSIGQDGAVAAQYDVAKRLWRSQPHLISTMMSLLESGPLQAPLRRAGSTPPQEFSTLEAFVRAVTLSGNLSAQFGNVDGATQLILLALKLHDRLLAAKGALLDYLVVAAYESMATSTIRHMLDNSGVPINDCKTLLAALTPAPATDVFAEDAVRTEFFSLTLRSLEEDPAKTWIDPNADSEPSDPSKPEPFAGNYDARETAEVSARLAAAVLTNVARPLSQYDDALDAEIGRQVRTVPKHGDLTELGGFPKWWEKMKFRYAMNNSHNSIGRSYLREQLSGRGLVKLSCNWRALRDATRVLLASRIYRASHGGKLPESTAGFVPLVGAWPTDPYNGKAMIYLPTRQKVYCVGDNLVDDGGDFGQGSRNAKDVGLSLEALKR